MKLLICTSFNILSPSAGKNRLNRMRRALTPHGIEAILVGAGNPEQIEPWRLRDTPDGPCITYNPNRVKVWRHSRAMKFAAQAAMFYTDFLPSLIDRYHCDGIIDYSFMYQVSRSTLSSRRQSNVFVVADAVEYMALQWHYLLNGVNISQFLWHQFALPKMNGIIGISNSWCDWASQRGIQNVWIPGFAKDSKYVRKTPTKPTHPFTLVFIGHLVSRELPKTIFQAIRICNNRGLNIRMNIIGNIDNSHRTRLAFRELEKDVILRENVNFLGFIDEDERDKQFANADAFVLLRADNLETDRLFPTRLPEYLLSGNPVILSNAGSFAHCFEHRKNIWFVPPGDNPVDVADAIIHLAQNQAERMAIGARGRETALQNFSLNVLGTRLANFLKEVARNSRREK